MRSISLTPSTDRARAEDDAALAAAARRDPAAFAGLYRRYGIALDGATVAVPGPWEMSWNLHAP